MASTSPSPQPPDPTSDEREAERWGRPQSGWRLSLYRVIFESDTPAGQRFDKWLVALILASLVVVIAESEEPLRERWALAFDVAEWGFTLLFTIEYLLRLVCVDRPARYARSFFGVVDFLSIAPTYLAVLFPGLHALIDVRVLRLLRVFRIFKLTSFIREYHSLGGALAASWRKITVFVTVVAMVVVVMGTLMYVVEGPAKGFTSILTAIYWAATTMTTTGYGDITPKTELGRVITTLMMLLGWGTLAVPTGIVTTEMALQRRQTTDSLLMPRTCPGCGHVGHVASARHCSQCGSTL
jgi:voltage-gated potassium channel